MDSVYFPFSLPVWISLAAGLSAAIVYFLTRKKLARLETEYERLQIETEEITEDSNRKIREVSQQLAAWKRRAENAEEELTVCRRNAEREKENLLAEIKQLNIQLAAGENELEVMRMYWARKEQEWQAIHESLESLLTEKDRIIADLHAALAKLAAAEFPQNLQQKLEEVSGEANIH